MHSNYLRNEKYKHIPFSVGMPPQVATSLFGILFFTIMANKKIYFSDDDNVTVEISFHVNKENLLYFEMEDDDNDYQRYQYTTLNINDVKEMIKDLQNCVKQIESNG